MWWYWCAIRALVMDAFTACCLSPSALLCSFRVQMTGNRGHTGSMYRRTAKHCSTGNIVEVPRHPTSTPPTPKKYVQLREYCEMCWERLSWWCCCAIRVSVDALYALLDCALGFFPCYFLFGCKDTSKHRSLIHNTLTNHPHHLNQHHPGLRIRSALNLPSSHDHDEDVCHDEVFAMMKIFASIAQCRPL